MAPVRHRIFISHSHVDNDFGTKLAQDLCRVLTDEDAVFYDILGLYGGEVWWEKIVEELSNRDAFLLVLSPDAMNSQWVRREINIAFNRNKYIIPILYRTCTIRADLEILQIISFLAPKSYEVAFQEVLGALGLPKEPPLTQQDSVPRPTESTDLATVLLQQMETAFNGHDWPDVIRKASYLIRRTSGNASSTVYRLQGLAFLEEGEEQQAQEALETALALVSDRQQRLTLLSDHTALLARQEQWAKVLQQAKEALHLVPNDPGWLATQQQAQNKLGQKALVPSSSQKETSTRDKEPSPTPQKTKKQWVDEGDQLATKGLYEGLKTHKQEMGSYEEALNAYKQAIRLPSEADLRDDAPAHRGKGDVFYIQKKYSEAEREYDEALECDSHYALAYNGKGLLSSQRGKIEEAIQFYEQAIKFDVNCALAYANMGFALRNKRDRKKALKAFEDAVAAYDRLIHDEEKAFLYYYKIQALRQLGPNREDDVRIAKENARRLGFIINS